MTYNDYKYVLVIRGENDQKEEVSKELRISKEQVKHLLTEKQIDFLDVNGWVVTGKTLIETRSYSINELNRRFPMSA